MEKYFSLEFYNPNSIYEEGVKVRKEVERYRVRIAQILGVAKEGVIFTSGATEANTLAIRGVKSGRIVVESDSHPSVFEAIQDTTATEITLISSTTVDNKLGRKIREERKKKQSEYPLLHIDASQTANYFNVSLEALACDLLTLDSAKLYGPKGIGALVVRRGVKIKLPPFGTLPVPLIAGFAKAFEIALRDRETEFERLDALSAKFVQAIEKRIPNAEIGRSAPNLVNISIPNILPELLVLALNQHGVMVSAGVACDAHKPEPLETPVRFSFGRETMEKDIYEAVEIFCHTVDNLIK